MLRRSRGGRRMSSLSTAEDVSENLMHAIVCLAEGLGIDEDTLGERAFAGGPDSVRIFQMLYDLIFFTYGNTSSNGTDAPLTLEQCRGGHRILESFLTSDLDAPATGGDVVVNAFCDGSGNSCSSASAASSGSRVVLTFTAEGDCE
jgi:hypothetical protein